MSNNGHESITIDDGEYTLVTADDFTPDPDNGHFNLFGQPAVGQRAAACDNWDGEILTGTIADVSTWPFDGEARAVWLRPDAPEAEAVMAEADGDQKRHATTVQLIGVLNASN